MCFLVSRGLGVIKERVLRHFLTSRLQEQVNDRAVMLPGQPFASGQACKENQQEPVYTVRCMSVLPGLTGLRDLKNSFG